MPSTAARQLPRLYATPNGSELEISARVQKIRWDKDAADIQTHDDFLEQAEARREGPGLHFQVNLELATIPESTSASCLNACAGF